MNLRDSFLLIVLSLCALPASTQERGPRHVRMAAVEAMLGGAGVESLAAFASEHLAPSYRDTFEDEQALLQHLRELRATVAPIGGVGVTGTEDGIQLHIKNHEKTSVVAFSLEPEEPHRIVELVLASVEDRDAGPRVTWDSLQETLEQAAADGFCGSVLAVREGEVVLERGYGFADPKREHPVTPDTLFAIGSTPIDFTHGAVLKLEEMGKLSLSDPITRFFDDVPEPKRAITLEHLRTGRSGLIDFPGLPGVDENLDLSWIDRDEFLRRVFAAELLFEPGARQKHSHCAWGVLAAVVEIASGQGYEEFLREHFFGPAGMERTGHYPWARKFPAGEVAVGLGGNVWGEVNSPAYWGETSWLVLGSGGMVSTPRDLYRWRPFLKKTLGAEARRKYGFERGVFMAEGGNDRGFINTIGAAGDGSVVIVCSNSHAEMDDFSARIANAVSRTATSD